MGTVGPLAVQWYPRGKDLDFFWVGQFCLGKLSWFQPAWKIFIHLDHTVLKIKKWHPSRLLHLPKWRTIFRAFCQLLGTSSNGSIQSTLQKSNIDIQRWWAFNWVSPFNFWRHFGYPAIRFCGGVNFHSTPTWTGANEARTGAPLMERDRLGAEVFFGTENPEKKYSIYTVLINNCGKNMENCLKQNISLPTKARKSKIKRNIVFFGQSVVKDSYTTMIMGYSDSVSTNPWNEYVLFQISTVTPHQRAQHRAKVQDFKRMSSRKMLEIQTRDGWIEVRKEIGQGF